jgi:hypothetical protein
MTIKWSWDKNKIKISNKSKLKMSFQMCPCGCGYLLRDVHDLNPKIKLELMFWAKKY